MCDQFLPVMDYSIKKRPPLSSAQVVGVPYLGPIESPCGNIEMDATSMVLKASNSVLTYFAIFGPFDSPAANGHSCMGADLREFPNLLPEDGIEFSRRKSNMTQLHGVEETLKRYSCPSSPLSRRRADRGPREAEQREEDRRRSQEEESTCPCRYIDTQSNEEHANGWPHPKEEAKRRVMLVVRSKSLGKNPAAVARKSPSNKPIKKASRKKSGTENT
ncbi:hypothetical protein THAOC_21253 [Thalassiosira oceanica]|uniref:Uncharacterized protein n=1 Tax=Thalassiosira oceanica TaxID=159749 RepID=K0RXU4_THAOC|nr:hypothetical protein THAOC_21253 [Thalassiosira oceanica]|eukprot:EJK58608.1 hypothetical protein THAOC_21253 [Thalassiosira oceanica]